MPMRPSGISDIIRQEVLPRDARYAVEAYEFTLDAWQHTQRMLGRKLERDKVPESPSHHVSGQQLLEGVRLLAQREFGLMARTVLTRWGVTKTDDFGEIVYNLIAADLMSKTAEDTKADFHNVFDFEQAFNKNFEIKLEDLE